MRAHTQPCTIALGRYLDRYRGACRVAPGRRVGWGKTHPGGTGPRRQGRRRMREARRRAREAEEIKEKPKLLRGEQRAEVVDLAGAGIVARGELHDVASCV